MSVFITNSIRQWDVDWGLSELAMEHVTPLLQTGRATEAINVTGKLVDRASERICNGLVLVLDHTSV